jgi:hypothetical protein
MLASLRRFPENHKLDYDHEHVIECSRCGQKYLLAWDDKDWIHLAEFAVNGTALVAERQGRVTGYASALAFCSISFL